MRSAHRTRLRLGAQDAEDDDGTLASDLWTNICFFFLVAFAFAVQAGQGIDVAADTALARGAAADTPPVLVQVARDAAGGFALSLGGEPLPPGAGDAALAERVAALRAEDPGIAFVVSAERSIPYAGLVEVMGRLGAAGVEEIGLARPAEPETPAPASP